MEPKHCLNCMKPLADGYFCAYCGHDQRKGIPLREYIRRGGKLSVEETFRIFTLVMEELELRHAFGQIHREISPYSITLRADGTVGILPTLWKMDLEDSAARDYTYSAMEVYQRNGNVGPWTDVYGICATVYFCLTGNPPPAITDRFLETKEFDWNIPGLSAIQIAALEQGTAIQPAERFQSVTVLRKALFAATPARTAPVDPAANRPATISLRKAGDPAPAPISQPQPVNAAPSQSYTAPVQPVQQSNPAASQKPPAEGASRKTVMIIVLVAAVVLGALLLILGGMGSGKPTPTTQPARPAAEKPATPPETIASPYRGKGEVAVFWYSFDDTYLSTLRKSMIHEFDIRGIENFHYDADFDQNLQINQIETAVAQGASVLVVNMVECYDDETVEYIAQLGYAADVPVIFFNRPVTADAVSEYGHVYVGTDYTLAGRMQGMVVGVYGTNNYFDLDLNGDGVISYVMLKGQEGNMEADGRTLYSVEEANAILTSAGIPALEYYDPTSDARYLVDENGAWSEAQGMKHMETILEEGYLVELVIANNDAMAIGAVEALQAAGYNTPGKTYIPVFGIDGTDMAKDLIATGAMTATVEQDTEGQARAVASIAENMLRGHDHFDGIDEEVKDNWYVNIPYIPCTGN